MSEGFLLASEANKDTALVRNALYTKDLLFSNIRSTISDTVSVGYFSTLIDISDFKEHHVSEAIEQLKIAGYEVDTASVFAHIHIKWISK